MGKLWMLATFSKCKAHWCPRELVGGLVADIETRGGETIDVKEVDGPGLDLPGMICTKRHWEDFEVDGLEISFPSTDLGVFHRLLEDAPVRRFSNGTEYHKIHTWNACVIFTPAQRSILLGLMMERLPAAQAQADKEDQEFHDALNRINKDKLRVVSVRLTAPPKDRN